jgi:hypothetical protein
LISFLLLSSVLITQGKMKLISFLRLGVPINS